MDTPVESWKLADILWTKELRKVPTKVTCLTCHGRGRVPYLPDGTLALKFPEPAPTYATYVAAGTTNQYGKDYGAWRDRERAWETTRKLGRCPKCPEKRGWYGYGTGQVVEMQEREVYVGRVQWPKGTRFDSRFDRMGENHSSWCGLCAKLIMWSHLVPVVGLDRQGRYHGMWVGEDCARNLLSVASSELRKKDRFLHEALIQ
jgi:hypothetical protein